MAEQTASRFDRSAAAQATYEQLIAAFALAATFGVLWRYETSWKAFAAIAFVATLAALSIIDVRTRTLPDMIIAPMFAVGIGVNAFHAFTGIVGALEGSAVGFGLLWGANELFRLRKHKHAIGFGDMKLAAVAGAWLGGAGIWQALAIAAACMGIWGAVAHVRSITRDHVAFGPVIAVASIASLILPLHRVV